MPVPEPVKISWSVFSFKYWEVSGGGSQSFGLPKFEFAKIFNLSSSWTSPCKEVSHRTELPHAPLCLAEGLSLSRPKSPKSTEFIPELTELITARKYHNPVPNPFPSNTHYQGMKHAAITSWHTKFNHTKRCHLYHKPGFIGVCKGFSIFILLLKMLLVLCLAQDVVSMLPISQRSICSISAALWTFVWMQSCPSSHLQTWWNSCLSFFIPSEVHYLFKAILKNCFLLLLVR